MCFYFCVVTANLSIGRTTEFHSLKTSLMTAVWLKSADLQAHLKNLEPLSAQMNRFLICVYYLNIKDTENLRILEVVS